MSMFDMATQVTPIVTIAALSLTAATFVLKRNLNLNIERGFIGSFFLFIISAFLRLLYLLFADASLFTDYIGLVEFGFGITFVIGMLGLLFTAYELWEVI